MSYGPPRLVDAVAGPIRRIAVSLPARWIEADPPLAAALAGIVPEAHLLLVAHERTAAAAARLSAARPASVLACPDRTPLTLWCRAALLAFDDGAIAPSSPPAPPTPARAVFERLAAEGLAVRAAEGVPARGGNLLPVGEVLLVGADEWRRFSEAAPGGGDAARLCRTLVDGTRRPVVVAGGSGRSPGPSRAFTGPDGARWHETAEPGVVERHSRQPAYHLDLHVTPTGVLRDGRPLLLVGDPALAARLSGTAAVPERAAEFDAAAEALDAAGFAVERLPLPLVAFDDPRARRRDWVFVSYGNALVESFGGGGRVHLPRFGQAGDTDLSACDEAAAGIFASLGLKVVPVHGLGPLARMAGGLHCAALVLARGEPAGQRTAPPRSGADAGRARTGGLRGG